jgi:uncharacterized protein (TIGR00288 family)
LEVKENQIAVFVDLENIVRGVEDNFGRSAKVSIEAVLQRLSITGRVVIKRAYADFSRFTQYRDELLGNAVSCIHMFALREREAKNGADIRIAVDVMEVLFAYPDLTHIALISGDSDFTPVVQKAREHGKIVVGVGVKGSVSRFLIQSCNEFVYYDTLIASEGPESKSDLNNLEASRKVLKTALEELARQYEKLPRAGQVKSAMIRLDPSFSEINYGFHRFTDFLRANDDIADVRFNEKNGDAKVALKASEVSLAAPTLEEAREHLKEIVQVLRNEGNTKPSGAVLKSLLLQRYLPFDEKKLGFTSFAEFLLAQKDLLKVSKK